MMEKTLALLPFFIFLSIFSQLSFNHVSGDGITSDGPSVEELSHYAGYYNLPHSNSARMFYFFFESRNNKTEDPVVIWLAGGPGCSGSDALFYENGPFKITEDLSLSWNDFGWDKVSNLIYVDQPVGTGFSYTNDNISDMRHNETGVSIDLYDFLQAFFKEHPKFVNNDFYLTGESYAGHYIPALASRIQDENKKNEGIPINLKGVAIGGGFTDPEIQYGAYGDFALQMKLISESEHESLKQPYVNCQSSIKECNLDGPGPACKMAYDVCEEIFNAIMNKIEFMNPYDLRKKCQPSCYNDSSMITFLNQENVKKALGVPIDITFKDSNDDVFNALSGDWMLNFDNKIPPLVDDGIKVLVYAGEYDFICNWLGISRWVEQMKWSGQKDFGSAQEVPFMVDGEEAGTMKSHGPLTFLKVHNAGHPVPMDQPNASLQMLQKWMNGEMDGQLSTPTANFP